MKVEKILHNLAQRARQEQMPNFNVVGRVMHTLEHGAIHLENNNDLFVVFRFAAAGATVASLIAFSAVNALINPLIFTFIDFSWFIL